MCSSVLAISFFFHFRFRQLQYSLDSTCDIVVVAVNTFILIIYRTWQNSSLFTGDMEMGTNGFANGRIVQKKDADDDSVFFICRVVIKLRGPRTHDLWTCRSIMKISLYNAINKLNALLLIAKTASEENHAPPKWCPPHAVEKWGMFL